MDIVALSEKDVRLIRLFASVVLGRWDDLTRLRNEAPEGEPDRAWREAVLQAHLFAGFPRTVEAFEVLKRSGGLGSMDGDEEQASAADGRILFERIYADLASGIKARLFSFHPELLGSIMEHAYGRVLSRAGLGADRRELLAVVALALTGQRRQLMSHLRGAVRCGAAPTEVSEAFEVVSDLLREDEREEIASLVERFAFEEVS